MHFPAWAAVSSSVNEGVGLDQGEAHCGLTGQIWPNIYLLVRFIGNYIFRALSGALLSKTEQKAWFPFIPFPNTHSLPYYQHLATEWDICYNQ